MRILLAIALLVSLAGCTCLAASAQSVTAPDSIEAFFKSYGYNCHDADSAEADLKTHGYYYVRHERGKWLRTRIHSSNHNWNSGYMDGRGGGSVEEWVSKEKGSTWRKNRDLTPDRVQYPGWRFNHVQPVVRPDGTRVAGMLLFYGWKDPDTPTAKAFLLDEGS